MSYSRANRWQSDARRSMNRACGLERCARSAKTRAHHSARARHCRTSGHDDVRELRIHPAHRSAVPRARPTTCCEPGALGEDAIGDRLPAHRRVGKNGSGYGCFGHEQAQRKTHADLHGRTKSIMAKQSARNQGPATFLERTRWRTKRQYPVEGIARVHDSPGSRCLRISFVRVATAGISGCRLESSPSPNPCAERYRPFGDGGKGARAKIRCDRNGELLSGSVASESACVYPGLQTISPTTGMFVGGWC